MGGAGGVSGGKGGGVVGWEGNENTRKSKYFFQ